MIDFQTYDEAVRTSKRALDKAENCSQISEMAAWAQIAHAAAHLALAAATRD